MNYWVLIRDTIKQWTKSRALLLGAALSFYAVISLPSLLVITISVAGIFLSKEDVQAELIERASDVLGDSAASVVESLIESASVSSLSSFSTIVGVLVLIWVATTVFSQLQSALNAIWGMEPLETGGAKLYLRKRIVAFLIVFGIGFLTLVLLLFGAIAAALESLVRQETGNVGMLLQAIELVISFVLIAVILIVTYKVLPAAEVAWLDALPGALITAFLFDVGKYVIAFYLSRSDLASAYGAASSLVLLLLWIYYSALIFLMGAVFTKVYSDMRRSAPAKSQ